MSQAPPEVPCYAVIFSSQRRQGDEGYAVMAERMMELARRQAGFLGVESARNAEGFGLTVSYWQDEASIASWKAQADHAVARRLGREQWYESFHVSVCKVERAYGLGLA